MATQTLGMKRGMALGLAGLGLFLFVGALTIVGAAVRESVLPPGEVPDAAAPSQVVDRARRRRARCWRWRCWAAAAGGTRRTRAYAGNLYAPPETEASVAALWTGSGC